MLCCSGPKLFENDFGTNKLLLTDETRGYAVIQPQWRRHSSSAAPHPLRLRASPCCSTTTAPLRAALVSAVDAVVDLQLACLHQQPQECAQLLL